MWQIEVLLFETSWISFFFWMIFCVCLVESTDIEHAATEGWLYKRRKNQIVFVSPKLCFTSVPYIYGYIF